MRLATVLTPPTDEYLTLAAQLGVTDVTVRYTGSNLDEMTELKERIEAFGLCPSVVEGHLPMEHIKWGDNEREKDYDELTALLEHMQKLKIPLVCYNFMAGSDWVRTSVDTRERGGALTTAFNLADVDRAVTLRDRNHTLQDQTISAEALWDNLQELLERILPVAERCGVTMAMHPDDPPLQEMRGRARIMNSVENFEKLVNMVPSPSNAICFCQGTFAEMGVDIPAAIRRLGAHIRFVHFRDVRGTADNFVETFHDNGPTNMVAAMRAYRDVGFDGPMRPDHVPQLHGEEDGPPGYTMMGRLFAYGYMRGLMQAVQDEGE